MAGRGCRGLPIESRLYRIYLEASLDQNISTHHSCLFHALVRGGGYLFHPLPSCFEYHLDVSRLHPVVSMYSVLPSVCARSVEGAGAVFRASCRSLARSLALKFHSR